MDIQQIIASIRVGNEHTPVPRHIIATLIAELNFAETAYQQALKDGADANEARHMALACALMHVLGVKTEDNCACDTMKQCGCHSN